MMTIAETKNLVSRIDPDTAPGALYAVQREGLWLGRSDGPEHVANVMLIKGYDLDNIGDYTVSHFAVTFDSRKRPTVIVESYFLTPEQVDVPADRSSVVEPYIAELDGMYDSVVRALQSGVLQARFPPAPAREELFGKSIVFSRGRLREL